MNSLSTLPSAELGRVAVEAALTRASLQPNQVDLCIMGQVLYAGEGEG